MPDNAATLYKSGVISRGAYNKILAATKVQPSKMADFEAKKRDEGAVRSKGDRSVASSRHIDQNQSMTARGVSTPPTKGGGVRNKGGAPKAAEIDQGAMQKPAFPAGGKAKKQSLKGASNKRAKGKVIGSGPEYGGPNGRAYG